MSVTKRLHLLRTEQMTIRLKSRLPNHSRFERFTWLGLIRERGAKGKHAQPGLGVQLAAFVSLEQAAEVGLHLVGGAIGQHVLQAVQQIYLAGGVSIVLQPAAFDKTKAGARAPRLARGKF